MNLSYGTFRGLDSVTMENSRTRVIYLKHFGGRMVSLVNLKTGREYLTTGAGDKHMIAGYGDNFNQCSDLSGVDEVFPTCNPCVYPFFPWEGHKVPPHGELWTQNWDFDQKGDELIMTAHGIRFPYTFTKTVRLLDTGVLHIEYRIINYSAFDMHFLWMLHPLLCMEDDVTITLPDGINKIISMFSTTQEMGKGRIFDWPIAEVNGQKRDMSRSSGMEKLCAEKYFAYGKFDKGYMAITYEPSGEGLGVHFPADKVPYAGIWISNGRLRGIRHVALEACIGGRDELGKTIEEGESAILSAKGDYTFYLEYELY